MSPLFGFLADSKTPVSQQALPLKVRLIHPAIGEITFAVTERRLAVGRSNVDIELMWDGRVSRRHAWVWAQDGAIWFEDLGSRNGSWIGETQIQAPIRLDPGISVLIGETVIALAEPSNDPWKGEVTNPGLEPLPPVVVKRPSSTEDLRSYVAPPPPAQKQVAKPRFMAPDRVEVTIEDRSALAELWTRELSKGALFVETTTPVQIGRPVVVRLQTAGGSLPIHASVVHVQHNGMGLQLSGVTPELRLAIQQYASGMSSRLEVTTKQAVAPLPGNEDLLKKAKLFLDWVERSDLYSALEIPPAAGEARIIARIKELKTAFEKAKATSPAPAATRFDRALQVLEKIEPRLSDPQMRLQYDFRAGHVRAEERLRAAASKAGPSVGELRRAWLVAAPELVDRAAFLTRQAFSARQRGALGEAVSAAKQALEYNPFFEELRTTLKAWEELDKKRRC